ncbi:MAG: hypothetical protein K6E16_04260 [Lachnospiraceae bacterium]|nr:hypothetical protein [Lachnospiraceae bacterium]
MSNRDRIEIDFAKAMERADELEAMAGELYELAKGDVSTTFAILARSFCGENGRSFLEKGKHMGPELFAMAEQLRKTAGNIRFSAELIYRAEKAAEMMIFA